MLNQRGRLSTGDAGAKRDEGPPRTPSRFCHLPRWQPVRESRRFRRRPAQLMTTLRMGALARSLAKLPSRANPNARCVHISSPNRVRAKLMSSTTSRRGTARVGYRRADQAEIGAAIVFPRSLVESSGTNRGTGQFGYRTRRSPSCPSMRKSRTITRSVEAARTAPIVPEILYGCPATTSLLCRSFHHHRLRFFRIRAWRRGHS
jgi:hypothetical protein